MKLYKKLKKEYRLIILEEDTFNQRFSIQINRFNILIFGFLFTILLILLISLMIRFTSLKALLLDNINTEDYKINFSIPETIIYTFILTTLGVYLIRSIFVYLQDSQINEFDIKKSMIRLELNATLREILKTEAEVHPTKEIIENHIQKAVLKTMNPEVNENILTNDSETDRKIYLNAYYRKDLKERFILLINSFSRRANINLIIGIIITLIAFTGLGISVFEFKGSNPTNSIINQFLPRFLILAFIQVFAFFFLKNYRSNISDIKYYQNELTNIEMITLGLFHNIVDSKGNNEIAKELLKTERNFVLEKNQTSLNSDNEIPKKELFEFIKSIIKSK